MRCLTVSKSYIPLYDDNLAIYFDLCGVLISTEHLLQCSILYSLWFLDGENKSEGSSEDGRREDEAAKESSTEETESSNDSDTSDSEVSEEISTVLLDIQLLLETFILYIFPHL